MLPVLNSCTKNVLFVKLCDCRPCLVTLQTPNAHRSKSKHNTNGKLSKFLNRQHFSMVSTIVENLNPAVDAVIKVWS